MPEVGRLTLLFAEHGAASASTKGTRESLIIERVNQELAAKATELGQHITEEPPEAAAIRDQINRLELMNDPDSRTRHSSQSEPNCVSCWLLRHPLTGSESPL